MSRQSGIKARPRGVDVVGQQVMITCEACPERKSADQRRESMPSGKVSMLTPSCSVAKNVGGSGPTWSACVWGFGAHNHGHVQRGVGRRTFVRSSNSISLDLKGATCGERFDPVPNRRKPVRI